jgi:membrane dipeptidase
MKHSIFDTHCDTLCALLDERKELEKNDGHLDLERMEEYEHYVQFFACFMDPIYTGSPVTRLLHLIDTFYTQIDKNSSRIMACTDYNDLKQARAEKKIAAFLSMEGGEPVESLAMLRNFYRLGVRCIALTWNGSNQLAAGFSETDSSKGLTSLGKEVVQEMNRLGMLVDVSHLSDRSFWDVAEVSKKPFIASHSNARAVCPHPRNLTDEQFLAVKKSGGCVGINLYPIFLTNSKKAAIDDIIRPIEHFLSLGGEDSIGIGADFDGVDCLPDKITGVQSLYLIFDRLLQLGYSQNVISKLEYQNFERIIQQI